MKEDNNIEELFRSSFGEFEVTPPPAVKQAVDRAIAAAPWYRRGWLWLFLLLPVAGMAVFLSWNGLAGSEQNGTSGQTASSTVVSGSAASSSQNTPSGKSGGDTPASASAGSNNADANGSSQDASSDNKNTATSDEINTSGKQRISGAKGSSDRASGTNPGSKRRKGNGNRSGVYPPTGGQVKSGPDGPFTPGLSSFSSGDKGNQSENNGASGDPLALNGGGDQQPGGNSDPKGTQQNQDPSKQDPEKQDPPKNDPPKTDSVPKLWKPDSTVKESLPGHNNKKNNDDGEKLWYASIYPGPQLSFNSSAPAGHSLDEKSSFRFSGEINRSLFNGYGMTSGVGYNSWSETYGSFSEEFDTTYYWDFFPVYDPQNPDSILYYDSTLVADLDTTVIAFNRQTSVRTFFIPLYVSKQFAFNDKWGTLVNAGAVFNFYKVTGDSATTKEFGMTLSGRVHATYKWKNWMFSAGFGGGWDLGVPASYAGYDRKRYWITPQVGIHLTF